MGYFYKQITSHYLPSKVPLKQNLCSDPVSDLEEQEEGREKFKLKQLEDKLELNSQETGHSISVHGPVQAGD